MQVLTVLPLTLALLLDAAAARVEPGDHDLRVMSFNVRLGVADDGEDSWEHRRGLLARVVQDFDPDLLGTQETWPFQAEYLLQQLPGREYVGWPRQPGDDEDGEECGILFRTARFEKLDEGQIWLSETPDLPGSQSWDSSLPRVATWVKLRDRARGNSVLVLLNTHFDHEGREARRESARLLRDWLGNREPGMAWIVTGDFNCAEASPPYRTLVGHGEDGLVVVDSYRAASAAPAAGEGTFHAFRGGRDGGRIDWILHSPLFETLSAAIDRTEEGGRFPSDHFPVTAVLRWRNR